MYFLAFCIFVVFPACFIGYHLATRKYLNPYKLIFIFGKKGSGKSTLLTKYAWIMSVKVGTFTVQNIVPVPIIFPRKM